MNFNMKDILFEKLHGEATIRSHGNGFQIMKGNKKDVMGCADTLKEAQDLLNYLRKIS